MITHDEKSYELWHNRMGYPSAKVFGSLSNVYVLLFLKFLIRCDVCLRAKYTRTYFSSSSNKTKIIF